MLPFHQSPTLRNIVLDCLADAIIVGLYLHNHISHLHSWVLTEARQVKHHTRGDKTMEAHLELRPGLSSAPCHYKKHCWPFLHLANASMSPSPSSLSTFFPQLLGLYYLQPRSISAFSIPSCLFLKLYNFFCPSFFSSIPHSYGWVKGLQNADSHQMKYARKGGWGELARWLCQHSLTTRCWAWGAGLRYILTHSYFHTEMFICLCLQVQKASLGVVNFVTVTLYSKFDILLD